MPSGTSIRQIVDDLRERKSTIARKFDECYQKCVAEPNYKATLMTAVGAWSPGVASTLPAVAPRPLTTAEQRHINDWPVPEQTNVKNAILNALNYDRQIEFFWDLSDDLTVIESKSDIDPPSAAQPDTNPGGKITVTFLTPRGDFVEKGAITFGEVKLHVTPP